MSISVYNKLKKNIMLKFSKLSGILLLTLLFGWWGCQPSGNQNHQKMTTHKLRVGVFNGNGASPICVLETMEALKVDTGIAPREVSATDIMGGVLDSLDVMVFPGGSASQEYNNMGLRAAARIKAFGKKKGHGLVGICAGGYLFSTTPGYPSLQIFPAPDIRDHYNRGRALIGFQMNRAGEKVFPELKKVDTAYYQYYDGPMYKIPKGSPIQVLATITTDIISNPGDPKGVSPGKPAFFTMPYGEGQVIASVGHPEATAGMRWMVPRMARFVAHRPLISYNQRIVKPEQYTHAVLYFPKVIAYEKANFWKLFSRNDDTIIRAIQNLHSIYSRPSIRWSIGLLRHTSPKVREVAAAYLLKTEYTWAIPDVEKAYRMEKNPEAKKALQKALTGLKAMIHQKN
jgi:glutamine amidotransferase-like uncharacterized protein